MQQDLLFRTVFVIAGATSVFFGIRYLVKGIAYNKAGAMYRRNNCSRTERAGFWFYTLLPLIVGTAVLYIIIFR